MQDTVAARKYAKALFSAAQAKNEVLACQQGLHEIARVTKLRASLAGVLEHPFIGPEEKKKMVHSALGEYATPLLERFLLMLVEKRRFTLLSLITELFQDEVDRFQNIQPLKIRAAYALSEGQQQELKGKLEGWLHSKVRMEIQIDPQLIGGLIIQTRDQVLDQSLRGRLKRLQTQLSA
jgi:F-type H+-transporting ATPase subunit delta